MLVNTKDEPAGRLPAGETSCSSTQPLHLHCAEARSPFPWLTSTPAGVTQRVPSASLAARQTRHAPSPALPRAGPSGQQGEAERRQKRTSPAPSLGHSALGRAGGSHSGPPCLGPRSGSSSEGGRRISTTFSLGPHPTPERGCPGDVTFLRGVVFSRVGSAAAILLASGHPWSD